MSKLGPFLREYLMPLAMLVLVAVVVHDKLNPPAAAVAPDRVESAARAYLAMQPTSLAEVALAIRSGKVPAADVGKAIAEAHTPAASELAAALQAAPDLAGALERASATIKKGLR